MHDFPYRPEVNDVPDTPSEPATDQPSQEGPVKAMPATAEPTDFGKPVETDTVVVAEPTELATVIVAEASEPDAVVETEPPPVPLPHADRLQEISRVAGELYRQAPDWVIFFREVLGVDGIVRRMFPEAEKLSAFEKSEEYAQIQQMVAKLREKTVGKADEIEPTKVITVRLPQSLHKSLRFEADARHTSMNKLCISKLLQVIDDQMVPSE